MLERPCDVVGVFGAVLLRFVVPLVRWGLLRPYEVLAEARWYVRSLGASGEAVALALCRSGSRDGLRGLVEGAASCRCNQVAAGGGELGGTVECS